MYALLKRSLAHRLMAAGASRPVSEVVGSGTSALPAILARLVTFFMPSEAVAACFGHTVVHAAITQPHEHVPYGLRPIAANSGDSDIAHLPSASRTAAVRGVDGE